MLNSLLKFLPITTILGYLFPQSMAKFQAWQASKTPENYVALGESVADELAQHFDQAALPALTHYEGLANPAITAIISEIEAPGVKPAELVVIEVGRVLASVWGKNPDPAKLEAAAVAFVSEINSAAGLS